MEDSIDFEKQQSTNKVSKTVIDFNIPIKHKIIIVIMALLMIFVLMFLILLF